MNAAPNAANPPQPRPVLTTHEVAELTGLTPQTVRAAADRGELPKPVRVGGRFLFPRRAVMAFLDGRAAASVGAAPGPIRTAMFAPAPAATSTRPVRTAATR